MLKNLLTLLALFVGIATSAFAQTSSSTTRALSMTIVPFLSCVGTRDIDYGTVRRIDGPQFTSATNYAEWTCDTDPSNSINITFTLPAALVNPQATGLPVPLTYGALAGFIDQNASQFNPSTGLAGDIVPTGHAVVRLGWPRNNTGQDELVRADVSNASSIGGGHYSAIVTLNVTLN
jgi:hypothetical protein